MSDKTFQTLGIVAAVMVVLAIVVGARTPTVEFDTSGVRYLVQGLDTAEISGVEVRNGEDSATLARAGKSFVVSSKLNYPASAKEINGLIKKCTKIRTDGIVTSDPSDHESLGMVPGGEKTQVVRFKKADDSVLIGVVAAEAPQEAGGGYYVRLENEDRVYHTTEWISFRGKGIDYIAKDIVKLERDDIARVDVAFGGASYSIGSPAKGTIELQNVPDGKKVKGSAHESVFGAASSLTMDDFISKADAKDLVFDSMFTVETRAKAVYSFELAEQVEEKAGEGDEAASETKKYFLRCSADYRGPARNTITITKDEEQEELERKEAFLLASDSVVDFNEKHQSWIYEVSSWKAEQMRKPLTDMLEDDDGKPSEISASHILVAYEGAERSEVTGRTKEQAKARAGEVLAKVQAGEQSFEDLAKEYSDGPSSSEGGDLGSFKFESMAPPFSEAAFALEVGAISEVVETDFGFHVIKRTK